MHSSQPPPHPPLNKIRCSPLKSTPRRPWRNTCYRQYGLFTSDMVSLSLVGRSAFLSVFSHEFNITNVSSKPEFGYWGPIRRSWLRLDSATLDEEKCALDPTCRIRIRTFFKICILIRLCFPKCGHLKTIFFKSILYRFWIRVFKIKPDPDRAFNNSDSNKTLDTDLFRQWWIWLRSWSWWSQPRGRRGDRSRQMWRAQWTPPRPVQPTATQRSINKLYHMGSRFIARMMHGTYIRWQLSTRFARKYARKYIFFISILKLLST